MERVLVTGASGFFGRHLLGALAGEASSIVALCRHPDALADLAHPALTIAAGDVRDAAGCAKWLAGVDTVFHLAAQRIRPGKSPAELTAVNEIATLRLAKQAADAGVRCFVNVATAQIYGPSAVALDETAPLLVEQVSASSSAASSYATSKARAALGLRGLAKAGAPVVTICPTIVFGPDHPSRPNRVTSYMRGVLGRRFDVVLGDGAARRDLVHVADVVAALLAAARRPEAIGEEILVTGAPISQRDLGILVAQCAGRGRPLVVPLPQRLTRAGASLLDRALGYDAHSGWASAVDGLGRDWHYSGEKARAILDHRPRALAQGVAETVAWILGG